MRSQCRHAAWAATGSEGSVNVALFAALAGREELL